MPAGPLLVTPVIKHGWLSQVSQFEQNCHTHAYTTATGVVISARSLRVQAEYSDPVLVPIPDSGIGIGAP